MSAPLLQPCASSGFVRPIRAHSLAMPPHACFPSRFAVASSAATHDPKPRTAALQVSCHRSVQLVRAARTPAMETWRSSEMCQRDLSQWRASLQKHVEDPSLSKLRIRFSAFEFSPRRRAGLHKNEREPPHRDPVACPRIQVPALSAKPPWPRTLAEVAGGSERSW